MLPLLLGAGVAPGPTAASPFPLYDPLPPTGAAFATSDASHRQSSHLDAPYFILY